MLQNVSSSWEAKIAAAVIPDNCPDTNINCQNFLQITIDVVKTTFWSFLEFL